MKKTLTTIVLLSCASVPVLAQNALPECAFSNFDAARGLFTISGAAKQAVNQQCLLTVNPKNAAVIGTSNAATYFVEGRYQIELSAGGGGGAQGATGNQGGGGGGAGAKVTTTTQYLAPGVYKLTIGAGGMGGNAPTGSPATDGNPTSLTQYPGGALVAGFPGADAWTSRTTLQMKPGAGGVPGDGSRGGDGADAGTTNTETQAKDGGWQPGVPAVALAGKAGGETMTDQTNAGGGGGASGTIGGRGGDGQSSGFNSTLATSGELGGGGGGGRGGMFTARSGAAGGDGFIRISPAQ